MEITKLNQDLSSLRNKIIEVGKGLYHLNQLTSFPISDDSIIEWSKSIDEILPELELKDLTDLIKDFKTGFIEYDNRLGIQNIFNGLRKKYPMKYKSISSTYLSTQHNSRPLN